MFLMTERSMLLNPGPIIALRGRLPMWNTPLADTGSAKTDEDVQDPAMRGSQMLLANHLFTSPTIVGSPTRSGLRLVTPVSWLMLVRMLTGLPLWPWNTP